MIGLAKKTEKAKKQCSNCKKEQAETNFYMSRNRMFKDGRVPICKTCVKEIINYNNINSVYNILKQLDVPFLYDTWERSLQGKGDTLGSYLRQINSLPQFENLAWNDSVFDKCDSSKGDKKDFKKQQANKFDVEDMTSDELEDKWGYGYTDEEYYCFEKKWRKLIDNYGEKTALHRESLINYIRFRVKEELATASGDIKSAKEWGALASKAQADGKLNVSQLSKSDISGGVDLVCQIFEAVESEVGVIPLLPKLVEQPLDDADMVIWCLINYGRVLEDKPQVEYREIWEFYREMLQEFCDQQGLNEEQKAEYIKKRNDVFRDLGTIYSEPLYSEDFEDGFNEDGEM